MSADLVVIDAATEIELVPLLSSLLERVLEGNSQYAVSRASCGSFKGLSAGLERFYSFRIPRISIFDYLNRIAEFSSASPACLVVAMVYIERLVMKQLALVLTDYNVHRLIVTAVLLAAKFLDDLHYDNKYWAKIAGISLEDLNFLEVQFLQQLEWKLEVSSDVFSKYYFCLLATAGAAGSDDEFMSSASTACASSEHAYIATPSSASSAQVPVRTPAELQPPSDHTAVACGVSCC